VTDRPVVLFDGYCGFCTWSVNFASHVVQADVQFEPYQQADVAAYGLTVEKCADAVQFVMGDVQLSGARAVAAVLRRGRGLWPGIGKAMDFRVVQPIAAGVYAVVARHRGRLWGVRSALSQARPEDQSGN
jgi:predicted DCC family thiol-disulfide oxidoreductase YuxK